MTSVSSVSSSNGHAEAGSSAGDQGLLVQAAIWRAVGEAARSGAGLSLSDEAQKIADAFPESGFSSSDIKDALVFAAVDEGAVLEVGRPQRGYVPFIEMRSMIRAASGRRARKGRRAKDRPADVLQATA